MEPPSLVTLAATAVPLPHPEVPHGLAAEIRWASLVRTKPRGYRMTRWAAALGEEDAMVRAFAEEKRWDSATTQAAAEYGHEACLRTAAKLGAPFRSGTNGGTTRAAAEYGHEACLRAAVELGAPWDPFTAYAAALNGHEDCLRAAVELGAPWPPDMMADLGYTRRGRQLIRVGPPLRS